jgi:MFS transporter, DHA1 family, inner membrane transport protein
MNEPPPARAPYGDAAPSVDTDSPGTTRVLVTAALAIFASSLFIRAVDPVIPQIAGDLNLDTATVALLSTAFALPYAVVQPVLGVLADMFGKGRLMNIAMATSALAGAIGAVAPNFAVLLGSRILSGVVAGGIFPIALALAGDLVPIARRQVAIGRLLAAAMFGNLLGSPFAGIVGDTIGWRGVFALVTLTALIAFVAVRIGFRVVASERRARFDPAAVVAGFRTILRNPLTKVCFPAVLLEGVCVFGLFPYVAALLVARGEARAIIAGLVIAGFGIGGIIYSLTVPALLGRLGERRMMLGGGISLAGALLVIGAGLPWPGEFLAFTVLGLGFYCLHGVIQIYSTELAPHARGLAMSLHSSFFFLGQALGPIAYRIGFASIGLVGTTALAALVLLLLGITCAHRLHRKPVSETIL